MPSFLQGLTLNVDVVPTDSKAVPKRTSEFRLCWALQCIQVVLKYVIKDSP